MNKIICVFVLMQKEKVENQLSFSLIFQAELKVLLVINFPVDI